ncbi:putative bifunctional diguanylate cyclase/phosphodiesterase [Tsuneonella sp. SYSU-LHT278]|uniref:putative bifunctional diguanylate cyclase/phosphodiesterase n=1 Tax=Tsuneonella sediminis TaxID=3416089 RepID=UPI003F7AA568
MRGVTISAPGGDISPIQEHARTHARFDALVENVPLLYLVAIANFLGMYLTAGTALDRWSPAIAILALLIVARLGHWIRLRRTTPGFGAKRKALRQTLVFAAIISAGFSLWGQYLIGVRPELALQVGFFGGFAAIGCAYALTGYTVAAAIPLFLLAGPLAIRLALAPDATLNLVGICILLVSVLIGRISVHHSRTADRMVANTLELEREQRKLVHAEKTAASIARRDPLTGLANRRAFVEELEAWSEGKRGDGSYALFLLDLDDFKPVNDVFGHAAGDALLNGIARNLQETLGETALLARMGGDEFAVLLPGGGDEALPRALAKRLCKAARKPVIFRDHSLSAGASCGLVLVSEPIPAGEALGKADRALYVAKAADSMSFKVFDAALEKAEERHRAIERLVLSGAVARSVEVAYQPIVSLREGGRVVALEALARWTDPQLGAVGPSEFIPIAERTGEVTAISEACFERACLDVATIPDLVLSFNVSAIQLCEADSGERLIGIMHRAGLSPARVQFEVTETALLSDLGIARENLRRFQGAGARVALDDFGAGNASLTYLREMRFDVVKLDGSLVRTIATSRHCRMLLKATVDLCHTMGMSCVAEMIETPEQLIVVRASNCDGVQGNLLSEPVEFETFRARFPSGFALAVGERGDCATVRPVSGFNGAAAS